MADRYWVGGTGTWDASTTTNWSTASGGSGGASVPTSTDNVYIDTNSGTGTITVSGVRSANNLTITASQSIVTSGGYFGIYGSLSFPTGGSFNPGTTIIIGLGTGTLNFGDKTIASIEFNGGPYTLASNLISSGRIHFYDAGYFNFSSYNVTATVISNQSPGTNTINLQSSTVTLTSATPFSLTTTSTTVNFDAGTSTIQCSSNAALAFTGDGRTFYNVSFTGGGTTTVAISGSNTFNNLSVTANTSGTKNITFAATQTINGALTTSGATTANRIQFGSSTAGTQRTLTVANSPTVTNSNFKDIALTGAASPWTAPAGVVSLGNNTGITFDTTTLYWIGGTGSWADGTKWSTSSGGSAAGYFPGETNNAIFDASSGTGTVTVTSGVCNDLTASSTSALTFTGALTVYGSSSIGGSGTFTATTITFAAKSTGKTISYNGKTTGAITFDGLGGGWTLSDNLISSGAITVTRGALDSGSYNITATALNSNNSNVRSINLGSSTLTLTSASPWGFGGSNLTYSAGTSTVNFSTASSFTLLPGNSSFYNIGLTGGGTQAITIVGMTLNNLSVTANTAGTKNILLDFTVTVNGTLSTIGTTAANRIQFTSTTSARRTLSVATIGTLTNTNWQNIALAGAASPWTAPIGVWDFGNNTGITFDTTTLYWIGGTGSWTDGTKWSTSSGGSAVNAAPGSTNSVVFDASSGTGTVTLNGNSCNDLTSSPTSALTFTGALTVYGSFSAGALGTYTGFTPTFAAITTGKTISSAGKTLGAVTFNGVGGGWTLSDAMDLGANALTVTNGSFVSGSYNITCGSVSSNNSNVRSISLGTSSITLSGATPLTFTTATNLTFNAGTSSITCSSSAALGFAGNGLTFYNVNFTGGGTTAISVTGANSYNNLSVTATAAGTKNITFAANQTINGTLSTSGTTSANRIQFGSSVAGTQRTLSVATMGTLDHTNWQDIALTGAASPWTAPSGVWNLGNTAGIVFAAGTTYYWVGGAGTWNTSTTTRWAASSGGAGGAGFPTASDSVVFDANSGTGTVTVSSGLCNDMTASSSTALTFSGSAAIYGSLAAGGSGTFTAFTPTFVATTTGKTIASGGKTLPNVTLNGVGGEWTLSDAMNLGANTLTLTNGSFLTGGYNLTAAAISSNNTNTRSINLGASTVTLSGATPLDMATTTNLTFNASTSTISLTNSAITLSNPGLTYYNLTTSGPASAGYNTLTVGANFTVSGTYTETGSNGNQRIKVLTNVIGTQRTITAAAVSLTDVDFYGIVGAGAATWSGTRVGNATLNSGITFDSPKTVYWNLAAGGNWMTSTAWATSSGGTAATTNFPLPQDTAIVEDTGLNTSATINVGTASVYLPNINFSTRTNAMTFGWNAAATACGNIIWDAQVTPSGTSALSFYGSTTFTSAGVTQPVPITVATGATLTTGDAFTNSSTITVNGTFTVGYALASGAITVAAGGTFNANYAFSTGNTITVNGTLTLGASPTFTTLALNGTTNLGTYTLFGTTCTLGAASVTNFGTGKISLSGNNVAVFNGNNTQTVTGSALVELTYSGSVGTRTINPANASENNLVSFSIVAGTDSVTTTASETRINDMDFTGFSGLFVNRRRVFFGNVTFSPTMTLNFNGDYQIFSGTSGTRYFSPAGLICPFPCSFGVNGSGITRTWVLLSDLTITNGVGIELVTGTLNTNGKTVTVTNIGGVGSALSPRGMILGSSTINITGSWNFGGANMTLDAGTSEIIFTSTGTASRTFAGGGKVYNKVTIGGATGTSTLTITGSNVFNTLASTKVVAHTLLITSGTTQTITNWNINGTAGNLVTLGSTSTTNHTLVKSGGGTVTADYMSISRSTAAPSRTWLATNSIDGGDNSGWGFGSFPAASSGLFFGSNF